MSLQLGVALARLGQLRLQPGHPIPQAAFGLAVLGEMLRQLAPDPVELRLHGLARLRMLLGELLHQLLHLEGGFTFLFVFNAVQIIVNARIVFLEKYRYHRTFALISKSNPRYALK